MMEVISISSMPWVILRHKTAMLVVACRGSSGIGGAASGLGDESQGDRGSGQRRFLCCYWSCCPILQTWESLLFCLLACSRYVLRICCKGALLLQRCKHEGNCCSKQGVYDAGSQDDGATASTPCADLPLNIFAALSRDGYVRHTALSGDPEFR